ncbi:MAG: nickel-responsive transcriptional regulator NikR [Candidatus Omnitrophota bacterium]
MSLVRFGVSLEGDLLKKFDALCAKNKYENRSEAIRDMIRNEFVKEEWASAKGDVSGVITIVYDHHKRELVDHLINVQHDHHGLIIASQHIHLNHHNCLEVIIVKGKAAEAKDLARRLRSVKGVKHGEFIMTTLGEDMK